MWTFLRGAMALLTVALCTQSPAQSIGPTARPAVHDSFEGPEVSWRAAAADTRYVIDLHQRRGAGAHTGSRCEHLQLRAEAGSYVLIEHDLPRAAIIAELRPSVWVRADRAGVQVLGRIVLPHSRDSSTGQPLTFLARGSGYTRVGGWQQLEIVDLPHLVERQVRVLRAQRGAGIDPRGAVLDKLVLNLYGGPGATAVWIDDLHVDGIVSDDRPTISKQSTASVGFQQPGVQRLPEAAASRDVEQSTSPQIKLAGSLLTAGGRPLVPRSIDWNGESLTYLKGLGFNTVRFASVPRQELLSEAARLGLWLIVRAQGVAQMAAELRGNGNYHFGSEYDPVLAWDLGEGLSKTELQAVEEAATFIRRADSRARPLVATPASELRSYSRLVDVLCTQRSRVGSSVDVGEYSTWLKERSQLARPGTPFWASIPTELPKPVIQQWQAFRGPRPASSLAQPLLDHEEIRQLALAAVAAGMRGLLFQSSGSLEGGTAESRARSAMLKLLNLELQLIEPWAAAGNFVTTATASDASMLPIVLQAERSRLLIPLAAKSTDPSVGGDEALLSIVAPAPEGNKAYLVDRTELRPLATRRAPGGIRIELEPSFRRALLLLTGDDAILRGISQRIESTKQTAIALEREITAESLRRVQIVDHSLATLGQRAARPSSELRSLGANLASVPMGTQDRLAVKSIRGTSSKLNSIKMAYQWRSNKSSDLLSSNPLTAHFEMLPEYARIAAMLSAGHYGANRSEAGSFEDLQLMLQSGWRHFAHPQSEIRSSVELSSELPHGGSRCLRLKVAASDPAQAPALLETGPVWVTSAPVPVQLGDVVRIEAWVRIAVPITASSDGLLILDTEGGEALAQRIVNTQGWVKTTAYRVITRPNPLTVSFAMTGIGSAWIDDVSVQVLTRGSAEGRVAGR